MQLLGAEIPKAQKRQSSHQYFFVLLGSACIKAACKILVKSNPGLDVLIAKIFFKHVFFLLFANSPNKG